jgi:hypothetical protein
MNVLVSGNQIQMSIVPIFSLSLVITVFKVSTACPGLFTADYD